MTFSNRELQSHYRYAYILCLDSDEAFDLLKVSVEKFFKICGPDQVRPRMKNSTFRLILRGMYFHWLYPIHQAAGTVNKTTLRSALSSSHSTDSKIHRPSSSVLGIKPPEFDFVLDKNECSSKLQFIELLSSLEPKEREILYFHLMERKSLQEIAELTHQRRGAVLSILHELQQQIQSVLSMKNEIKPIGLTYAKTDNPRTETLHRGKE